MLFFPHVKIFLQCKCFHDFKYMKMMMNDVYALRFFFNVNVFMTLNI